MRVGERHKLLGPDIQAMPILKVGQNFIGGMKWPGLKNKNLGKPMFSRFCYITLFENFRSRRICIT